MGQSLLGGHRAVGGGPGVMGGTEGEEWGYEEAMVECGVSSRLLWNAQLWAQLHQQKEGALLDCSLPLGEQWEQGKGDWTWNQEMRCEAQPWVRTLCVSNHCFSSGRHDENNRSVL